MPRFIGRNASTTDYTIKSTSVSPSTGFGVGAGDTFDVYVNDAEAADVVAQLDACSGVTYQKYDADVPQARLVQLGVPATASATACHASFAGNNASNVFPGAFTNPGHPRNLTVTMAGGWDGGNVIVTGTDQFDAAQSETFTAGSGVTRTGAKIFKTVTSAVKGAVGVSAAGASIGTGQILGIPLNITAGGVLFVDATAEVAAFDLDPPSVLPSATANGARVYQALVTA